MSLISNQFKQLINKTASVSSNDSKLARVTRIDDLGVYIMFYGEETESQKPYKRLSNYIPSVGDTIMLVNINNSYVITGKVI